MNFKRTSKIITRALVSVSLHAALGGINPGLASQVAVQDGESFAIGTIQAASRERPDSLSPQNANGSWTCPMHPEIHHHELGKCPVCKMKLIKAKSKNV
ncbi:MAG: heavy metal-binding domain-containing protein [Thiobacillus sp.]|nr:heavy metal-binding domain-containing protein [Thiobacillus sp.]